MGREKDSSSKETLIGDTLKKIISVGVGAAFLTEDVIKSVLGDLPLSKDIVNGLVQNAKHAKEDFIKSIRDEVASQLSKVDPKVLLEEIIEGHDIEIQATLKFKKKKESTKK